MIAVADTIVMWKHLITLGSGKALFVDCEDSVRILYVSGPLRICHHAFLDVLYGACVYI